MRGCTNLVSLVHEVLRGLQVEAGLFVVVVNVRPCLQVRNVQGITQGLDMGPKDEVIWSKQGLDAIANLLANLQQIMCKGQSLLNVFYEIPCL